jgi:gas vesicle protein
MAERHDDQAVVVIERSSGVGTFFAGLAFGAGLALLLAPQSGEETRELLRARAKRLRDAAGERLEDLQDAVESGYERTKAGVEAGIESARHAFDAGKAAVRSARDELETRLADARARRDDGDADEETDE